MKMDSKNIGRVEDLPNYASDPMRRKLFDIAVKSDSMFNNDDDATKPKKTKASVPVHSQNKMYQNIITKLIQIKETRNKSGKIQKFERAQGKFKIMMRKMMFRTLSVDTDLELTLDSLINVRIFTKGFKIKGNAVVEDVPKKAKEILPKVILYQSKFEGESPKSSHYSDNSSSQVLHADVPKGVIRYKLSDRTFIDKGWTMLPIEKVVRKKNVYRMSAAHPEYNWFEINKKKGPMMYDTGERLVEFEEDGRGRWYYKNGRLALDYYNSEEEHTQQRVVVYSNGEHDERGRSHPVTALAMFDYLGNGVVLDHTGKIRLKYNQSDGVVLDRSLGPVSHWKWHSLNDPPVLQRVMMDTYLEHKDLQIMNLEDSDHRQPRLDNTDMLEIEFSNCIKEQRKKISQKFQPYQIKMKALKINDHFSLRIIDQANVYLTFNDGSANFKLNLGMIIDNRQIVSTETEDTGEVSIFSMDKARDKTDSIFELQQNLDKVRRKHCARLNREQKIHPVLPADSVDRLTAAKSRPIYPLRTVKSQPLNNVSTERICQRKPSQFNLYYDNRLM